mmetsp:Transcript_22537/g.33606  ORF Transcript_22537/g.33606 Transcript_22537/m.33606 type:complete len:100 (+) Transcript_22537:34-333(+)
MAYALRAIVIGIALAVLAVVGDEGQCIPSYQLSDWNTWFENANHNFLAVVDGLDRLKMVLSDVEYLKAEMESLHFCFQSDPGVLCPDIEAPARLLTNEW